MTVRSVACAIFIYIFSLFPPFKKFKKNICSEGYSKACSRKIRLWSLSNITSKKNFEKFKHFFQLQFFFKNSFFLWNSLITVYNIYFFFIKIGQAVFKKNHFLNFSSRSIAPKKMNFQGYHWEKFYITWMRTYDRNFKLIRAGADFVCLPGYAKFI